MFTKTLNRTLNRKRNRTLRQLATLSFAVKNRISASGWRYWLYPATAMALLQMPLGVNSQNSLSAIKKVEPKSENARLQAGSTAQKLDLRIRFMDTDVADVLQALSLRTHDNIVYAGQGKRSISINVNASSTAEALRYITSAAGLAFRAVGNSYVVAPSTALRQAIEPLGEQVRVPITAISVADAARTLEASFPYLTVRPAGSQILLIGATDDLQQAEALLRAQDEAVVPDPVTSQVLPLKNMSAAQATAMLKSLYPELKVEAIGDEKRPGGTIGVAGAHSRITAAQISLTTADNAATERGPDRVYRIYNIKYSSARVLRTFLHGAAPDVTVLTGPESYSPPRPSFRPITGATLGNSSTGSGGTTGGTIGGTIGGTGGGTSAGAVTDVIDSSSNLPSDSGGANTGNTSTSSARGEVNDRARTLVLSGPAREVESLLTLLDQVDTAPRQVLVDVKVIDVTPQFSSAVGLAYTFAPVAITNVPPGTPVDPATGAQSTPTTVPFNSTTFSRLPLGTSAQISAVATKTHSKLLANPRIQVIDNDDASIFIGDTVRTQIAQSGIAGTTIQVLEFPVGIILLVRPRVNADGRITMRIHPVVSTITSIGAGNIPNTSNREAETTVMVNDGETIVIGGLIRDEFSKSLQEVPILSRLPLVGELFRYRSNNRIRSEVQVFITPHLSTNGPPLTDVERNNAAANRVEDMHLSIPPPRRSGLPNDPHGELPTRADKKPNP